MRTAKALLSLMLLVGAAGCATPKPAPAPVPQTVLPQDPKVSFHDVGDHFTTLLGHCKVIRVQDTYRLIRCVNSGPIQGCYEDLLTVPRLDLELNEWRSVDDFVGLEVAFLTPDRIAVRQTWLPMLPLVPTLPAPSAVATR